MQPSAEAPDGIPGGLPGDPDQDEYGFIMPSDDDGIFVAGVAHAPLDVSMSVQSATAAALKAIQAVRVGA
jgi:quinone-modifying oxidoreductase subunit QmoA